MAHAYGAAPCRKINGGSESIALELDTKRGTVKSVAYRYAQARAVHMQRVMLVSKAGRQGELGQSSWSVNPVGEVGLGDQVGQQIWSAR